MTTVDQPSVLRRLDMPSAARLAALASIFAELQTVLRCCELLVADRGADRDELGREALWTTALLSYARCFTARFDGVALSEQDVTATALQGEVLEWHAMLRRVRKHYADPAQNPRERFCVGAATGTDGAVRAIAITSSAVIDVDEQTVRQTGALALALSKLVDERMDEQQRQVLAEAGTLSASELERLPLIEVSDALTASDQP